MALLDIFAHPTSRAPLSLRRRLSLWRSRKALSDLDAERLDDIGLSRSDARAEARRGIWDDYLVQAVAGAHGRGPHS